MSILDDVGIMAVMDPGGMRCRLERFPGQLREAAGIGASAPLTVSGDGVTSVVVLGMGGSAIGGEIAAAWGYGSMRVPMTPVRGYSLPGYVGPSTLAYVSSYSGNTEETLSSYDEAHARGARIVCSTTGGEVARRAEKRGHDVVRIPSGYPPRAALGFGLVPLLIVLHRLGLMPDPADDIESATSAAEAGVERFGLEVPEARNAAKKLASWFLGHVPVVYGATPLTAAVAHRWCGQLSENSKIVAHSNELPEMNHNEIVGWSDARPVAGTARVVFLRDADDHPRVARRMEATREIVAESGAPVREYSGEGDGRLARLVSLIQLGDFASFYLALLNGVDPTPVAPIDRLKGELAKA